MFNHLAYLNEWLSKPDLTDAGKYGITIEPVAGLALGEYYWRIIGVHHLTPEENVGKQNLFLQMLSIEGQVLRGAVAWGWEGQRDWEPSSDVMLDKPANEPGGNIGIYWGQRVWAEANSLFYPSERVINVHTMHPNEGDGNRQGHHSFYVAWQLTAYGGVEPEPDPEPEPEPGEVDRLPGFLVELKALMEKWEK